MPLSSGQQGTGTNPTLNKLQYAIANTADDLTTAATGDKLLFVDVSDSYAIKYGDADNVLETLAVTATAAEINRVADTSARLVAGGATLTLTEALHDGKTVLWDTAAGTILTLPAASASGMKIRCVVSVTATSNSHIVKVANASDIMVGSITTIDTDTGDATLAFAVEVADAFDTVTLNRTTTGLAAVGDWVELQDVAVNRWAVTGVVRASGVVATPFSATV